MCISRISFFVLLRCYVVANIKEVNERKRSAAEKTPQRHLAVVGVITEQRKRIKGKDSPSVASKKHQSGFRNFVSKSFCMMVKHRR